MNKTHSLLATVVLASTLHAQSFSQLSAEVLAARTSESISPSGRFVAFASGRSGIQLVDTMSGRRARMAKPDGALPTFSWPSNEAYVVVSQESKFSVFKTGNGYRLYETNGSLAEISPDGSRIAFVRDHNLWTAATDTGTLKQLTNFGGSDVLVGEADPTYGREFDVQRHYWWSPDSASLVFIETQFQNSAHYVVAGAKLPIFRLKKVEIQTGKIQPIRESDEEWPYLLRVTWHPDSKRILFYRMNRLQTSVELCISENGEIKTIETEKDAYWVNVPETPLVVGGGADVVVSSERTGARHVYLYRLSGELIRDLTPTDLEVYQLHRAADPKGAIYVSGSSGNHQELQLFQLPVSGGAAKQLTWSAGWHEVNLGLRGSAFLDEFSDSMTPPTLEWRDGRQKRLAIFRDTQAQKAVSSEFWEIKTHDNVRLPARLYKPDDFDAKKKYPMIFYTYSGPRGRVVMDSWGDWQMAWNREMVRKGYLVLAVDVRGSGGYGHLFEEYIHYRFGAQEVADLREVVTYLQQLSYVDKTRLGIWGCDYGAHTVVHAMLQFPGGFKGGFADAPIVEWTNYDAYFTERYLGLPASHISEYDDSTALDDARRMTGTLMVYSSPGNPLIRSGQAQALLEAMKSVKKNKAVIDRLHMVEEADPNYRNDETGLAKLMEQMTAFFTSTL